MAAAERVKLSLGEAVAWALLHKRSDRLAPFAVRHACHRHARDAGMRVQDILDLARIDVLAAANDHVLEPALDAAIAGGSMLPRSPVWSQPSLSITAAVARS